jgi:NADH-quinone oxidoreductase subunit L
MDRAEAAMGRMRLGRLYQAMRDRFYFDEIYQATIVRSSILLAALLHAFDRGVLDGLVNLAGRVAQATSAVISRVSGIFDQRVVDRLANLTGSGVRALSDRSGVFDLRVVDRLVSGVGEAVKGGGRLIRPIQTGRVQNYLLLACLMMLALVLAFGLIRFLQIW